MINHKDLPKMVKIVSAVTKFTKDDEEYVRVYYIDGSKKIFSAFEWQALVKEGKDLWDSHQGEVENDRHYQIQVDRNQD